MISPPQKKQKLDDLSYPSSEGMSNGHGGHSGHANNVNLQPNPFFGSGASLLKEENKFEKSDKKINSEDENGRVDATDKHFSEEIIGSPSKPSSLGDLRGFRIPKKGSTEANPTGVTNDVAHQNKIENIKVDKSENGFKMETQSISTGTKHDSQVNGSKTDTPASFKKIDTSSNYTKQTDSSTNHSKPESSTNFEKMESHSTTTSDTKTEKDSSPMFPPRMAAKPLGEFKPRMSAMPVNDPPPKPRKIREEYVPPLRGKEYYLKPKPNAEAILAQENKWCEAQTFYPTMEEFKDLKKYVTYLESQGAHLAGICKIVPPKEWVPRKIGYNPLEMDIDISYPVQQNLSRGAEKGAFRALAASYPKIAVKDYVKLATKEKFLCPAHDSYEQLEELYWEQQYDDTREAPIYGADTCDSITDLDQKVWNIRRLDSLLTDVLDDQIPGVNMPYLYFGMWKATFSWHVEDMDLYSVNYLHYGAPKTWYTVPPMYAYKLERVANKMFPDMSSVCKNYTRHKCCMISPKLLEKHGVRVHKMQQEERNMIIVFPHAYHSGFNHGYNIAESTNFALERWVEYGKRFRPCTCSPDDKVAMDMEPFVAAVQPERMKDYKDKSDWDFHPDDPKFLVRAYYDAEELFKNDEMPEKDMRRLRKDISLFREIPEWYTKKYLTKDCGKCAGCENRLKDDCGECEFCKDMPKFGGLDLLSLPCIEAISEEDKQCFDPIVKKYEDYATMLDDHEWDMSDLIDSEADEDKNNFIVRGPRLKAAIRDAQENPGKLFIKAKKLDKDITEELMENLPITETSKITAEDLEKATKKGGGKGVGFAGALSEAELLERKSMYKCTKGKQHRFQACRKCEGCLRANCGECVYCQDMPRFGGMGVIKQKCETRVCVNPVQKMCDACVWTL